MRVCHAFDVPFPPDQVGAALCSEAFQLEGERAREGVVSSSYQVVARDADHLSFELRSVEYKRTKLGGLDRSATVNAATHCRWSGGERVLSWSYHSDGSERMKLEGSYRLAAAGTGTRVTCETMIEISVPLIGGQIAKYICRQFEASWPHLEERVTRHARG